MKNPTKRRGQRQNNQTGSQQDQPGTTPGGQPGQVEEPPTQSPPNKPGQYEDPKKVEEKEGVKLPPKEDPVKQDEPGDKGHVS